MNGALSFWHYIYILSVTLEVKKFPTPWRWQFLGSATKALLRPIMAHPSAKPPTSQPAAAPFPAPEATSAPTFAPVPAAASAPGPPFGGAAGLDPVTLASVRLSWATGASTRHDYGEVFSDLNALTLVGEAALFERWPHVPVTHMGYFNPPADAFLSGPKAKDRRFSRE